MESFFRRMSSIVRKSSNKSSDADENESEDGQDDNMRQRYFRQMQQRRRSAPDIHRRANLIDRLPLEADHKVTSFEQINTQNLTIQTSNSNLTRKYSATSK